MGVIFDKNGRRKGIVQRSRNTGDSQTPLLVGVVARFSSLLSRRRQGYRNFRLLRACRLAGIRHTRIRKYLRTLCAALMRNSNSKEPMFALACICKVCSRCNRAHRSSNAYSSTLGMPTSTIRCLRRSRIIAITPFINKIRMGKFTDFRVIFVRWSFLCYYVLS